MKLRVRGDSLRLRLTRSEVTTLVDEGAVEDVVSFAPDQRLVYALRLGGAHTSASFASARIEVLVPAETARTWAGGDAVAIEATQDAGDGRALRILVEKDFACLKERPHEDDGDAFPNPRA